MRGEGEGKFQKKKGDELEIKSIGTGEGVVGEVGWSDRRTIEVRVKKSKLLEMTYPAAAAALLSMGISSTLTKVEGGEVRFPLIAWRIRRRPRAPAPEVTRMTSLPALCQV